MTNYINTKKVHVFTSFFLYFGYKVEHMCTTNNFYLTKVIASVFRIPIWVRFMRSVIVEHYVSAIDRTNKEYRIRYRCSGVVFVLKANRPVLFVGCVGYVNRKSQKVASKFIVFIYRERRKIFEMECTSGNCLLAAGNNIESNTAIPIIM